MESSRYSVLTGEMEGCWKPRHPLKGAGHKLSLVGTHPGLQQRDDSSGDSRVIQKKTEFCGVEARDGGITFNAPVLSPPVAQPTVTIFPGLSALPLSLVRNTSSALTPLSFTMTILHIAKSVRSPQPGPTLQFFLKSL